MCISENKTKLNTICPVGGAKIRFEQSSAWCHTLNDPPETSARYNEFLFGVNMSGSRKPRSVANTLETAITTPSERILKECHSLYIDDENGKCTTVTFINSTSLLVSVNAACLPLSSYTVTLDPEAQTLSSFMNRDLSVIFIMIIIAYC